MWRPALGYTKLLPAGRRPGIEDNLYKMMKRGPETSANSPGAPTVRPFVSHPVHNLRSRQVGMSEVESFIDGRHL